jgi:hypothetical protein
MGEADAVGNLNHRIDGLYARIESLLEFRAIGLVILTRSIKVASN